MWSFKVRKYLIGARWTYMELCTNVNPYIPDVTWSERRYNLGKIGYV